MPARSAPVPDSATTAPAEIVLSGLGGPVRVIRDHWGIAHVGAGSAEDAFLANGYVHAEDRLWQMDAARRRAVGRFAEWAGPGAAPLDVLARRMDVAGASRRDAGVLAPRTTRMLERYAAGVNAFIDQGRLPPEYELLGEAPEPWEPWHSVAVMRQRGLLMGSIWFKLWRAAALGVVGPERVGLLRYDDGGAERFVVPQGEHGRRWAASLEALAPSIEALSAMAAPDATVAGSNNWAVDGRHTASGSPIVAGDPHRAFEIPGMYAQLHLACEGFDALGLTVPGVPGFPHFAHTERVAWCVTHAFADLHDLYVERFDPADPTRYAAPEGCRRAETREEVVRVRGAEEVRVLAVSTRHGPIVVGEPGDGHTLALRSMQLDPVDRSLDCLWPMLEARTLTEFCEATRGWGVVDHNLVGADRDGHIGVSIRAIVPRRERANGWLPVPGWSDAHEWRGTIPFEEMPREIDPPSGRVVTANNRPVPEDWPDYVCTDCHPSTRAERIAERLEGMEAIEAGDMVELLADTRSARALEIGARLVAVETPHEGARRLQALIAGWDGRMDASLLAPSAYTLVRQEMTRILARRSGLGRAEGAPVASVPPGIQAASHLWWTLPNLLRSGDESLLGGASWEAVMREALETVAERDALEPWGELHRPRFAHPLAIAFPDRAEAMSPDSNPVTGDGDCVCATGAYPGGGPAASYGSVARYVFDLGDWDRSRWVVFHGASGDPGSPHYSDQNALWARGELAPAPFSEAAVEAHAASTAWLVAAP